MRVKDNTDQKNFLIQDLQNERMWAKGSKLRAIIAFTHPMAVLIFGGSAFILAIIMEGGKSNIKICILMAIAMAFAQIAIGTANEIFDFDLDQATKPWRALPAGYISLRSAVFLCLGVITLQIILSYFVSLPSMIFLLFLTGIGILYSAVLKGTALSWVAYAIAYPSVPVWVWLSLDKLPEDFYLIYLISFPLVISIHMINQLRDYDEDYEMGIKGIVQYLGKPKATKIAFTLLLLAPLPFILIVQSEGQVIILVLSLLALIHWILFVPCIYRYVLNPSPEYIRDIFGRLILTSPLLLLYWILFNH